MRKRLLTLFPLLCLLLTLSGGAMAQTPVTTQNFDGVTPPALPSGWSSGSHIVTNAGAAHSSPNSLAFLTGNQVGSTFTYAFYTTSNDGNGGDSQFGGWVYVDSAVTDTAEISVCTRMSSTTDSTANGYCASLVIYPGGSQFRLESRAGNGETQLVTPISGIGAAPAGWYYVQVKTSGSTISGRIKRPSDGDWLNSSGAWVADGTNTTWAATATDTTYTGAGFGGVSFYSPSAGNSTMRVDDLSFDALSSPAATGYAITGPTVISNVGASTYSVATVASGSHPAAGDILGYSDNLATHGTFSPTTQGFGTSGATTNTFTYTPPSGYSGAVTLTATSANGLGAGAISLTIEPPLLALQIMAVGDSITYGLVSGAGNSPPVGAAAYLSGAHGVRAVTITDGGVSGATSGDFVSGATYLVNAKAAAVTAFGVPSALNQVWVSMMIGVNDAATTHNFSKATYKANTISMINDVLGWGAKGVVLHYSPWGTASSVTDASRALMISYEDAINEIVAAYPGRVFLGDTTAFVNFQANQGWLADGLHPDATHSLLLGQWEGAADYRAITSGFSAPTPTVNYQPRRGRGSLPDTSIFKTFRPGYKIAA